MPQPSQQLPVLNPLPRLTLSRLTIALALVLGAALLWAVVAELRFERRTTEKVGQDYLSLLAQERLDAVANDFRTVANAALGPQVGGRMGSPYEQLQAPAPAYGAGSRLQCPGADGPPAWYFREDLRDHSFVTSQPVTSATASRVRRALLERSAMALPPSGSFGTVLTGDVATIYAVKYAPFDAPVAIYGVSTCRRALAAVLSTATQRTSADSLISVMAVVDRDTLIDQKTAVTRPLATTEVAGIRLSAYPAFVQPLSGIVIERDVVSPFVLALMLLGTVALASIAILQLVRDRRIVRRQAGLLATLSHELRTPLAQILLYSETLALDRVKGDDAKREAAQRIASEARGLAETVSNVLSLGSSERVSDVVTPVAPVIEAAISGVRALSDARAKVVVVVSGTPRVRLGQSALLQVVTNLLDNALKFGPAAQTVRISADGDAARVRITVDDEGPGIPPADRSRIWTRYFRVSDTEEIAGSGIGLWIVRDVALRAGGRVWADQSETGGARIVLELPAAET